MTTEREIVGLLQELHTLREAITTTKRREQELTQRIKDYLAETGQESVTDGEHGITARLVARSGAPTYDVGSMPDALVLRLRDLRALSVDGKVLRALDGKAVEVLEARRYEMPGGVTYALEVKRRAP